MEDSFIKSFQLGPRILVVVVLCSRFYRVVYSEYQHVNANITDASFKIVLLFHMCKGNACLGNSTAAVWEVNELLSDGKDPPPPGSAHWQEIA